MITLPFFLDLLHHETGPVGSLGRGTHYSVYRAVVFHDRNGNPLAEAQYHDVAVIWDEDNDTRVFQVIKSLYYLGMLSAFSFIGERKGTLTAILSVGTLTTAGISALAAKLQSLCADLDGDSWNSQIVTADEPGGIINDTDEKVQLYLANIKMLWQLGLKKVVPESTFM